jgi:cytochrome P450
MGQAPDAPVDFFDPATNDCPYHAYRTLRDEAPVWFDERTRMFVITRYDDVKMILRDVERFPSSRPVGRRDKRAEVIHRLYEEKGWVPGRTLAGRDDPEHRQMRAMFNQAFRPSKINELDPMIHDLAHRLVGELVAAGEGDWTRVVAIPLPLIVIGVQMGVDERDIWQIKAWTDAWVQRLGMMQTPDEVIWSTEMEIEAQHYFQAIFERLRAEPDDTLLSEIVNTVIPEWGRTLTDEELHAEMMADTFVGGSETTTNALSHGVKLLIEHPDQWDRLTSDPERYLPVLAEEVIRLEGPVQGLFRTVGVDVELHGVTIPAGSLVNIRYAAANRDDRAFERADEFDLDRPDARQHIGFGFGTHFCLGAPLARRELIHGFGALVEQVEEMWFLEGRNDFKVAPNYCLRALEQLHIGVRPRSR